MFAEISRGSYLIVIFLALMIVRRFLKYFLILEVGLTTSEGGVYAFKGL